MCIVYGIVPVCNSLCEIEDAWGAPPSNCASKSKKTLQKLKDLNFHGSSVGHRDY